MPAFLRSEGPFSMYDHSLRYDKAAQNSNGPTITDKATLAAIGRYENDIVKLKQLREEQKTQFYANIAL